MARLPDNTRPVIGARPFKYTPIYRFQLDAGPVSEADRRRLRAGIARFQKLFGDRSQMVGQRHEVGEPEDKLNRVPPIDVGHRDNAERLPVIIDESADSDLPVRTDAQLCHSNPPSSVVSPQADVAEAGEGITLPGGGSADD